MPLQFLTFAIGPTFVWGESGGTSPINVTHALPVNGLANTTGAAMGAFADLGENFDQEFSLWIYVNTGAVAPTVANTADVFLLWSHDGTLWPGKVTGSAGSYTRGTSDANLRQCGTAYSLPATADANSLIGRPPFRIVPAARYVVPVIANNIGAGFANTTPASANQTRIILQARRNKLSET